MIHTTSTQIHLSTSKARSLAPTDTPWIPSGPGQEIRPIRFLADGQGYVAELRLEPGSAIPPHRHTGEVHAVNLVGERRLHTGEVIGPGGYVFEPAGNVDTWQAVGATPAVVLVIVRGDVEYLGPGGEVTVRYNAEVIRAAYGTFCDSHGIEPRDLTA